MELVQFGKDCFSLDGTDGLKINFFPCLAKYPKQAVLSSKLCLGKIFPWQKWWGRKGDKGESKRGMCALYHS